jgi:hypothetical protein
MKNDKHVPSVEHIGLGLQVSVVREHASLREKNGDVIMWQIPVDAIGVVLDAVPASGSVKVAWDFGRVGWVLRDNLQVLN